MPQGVKSNNAPGEKSSPGAFVCQRCGNCCSRSGEVVISVDEAEKISALLGIPQEKFMDEYTALSSDRRHLVLAGAEDQPCIFLGRDEKGLALCRIQEAKPLQCREFPHNWNYPGWENFCGKKD